MHFLAAVSLRCDHAWLVKGGLVPVREQEEYVE